MRTPEYTDSHDNIIPVEAETTLNSGDAICVNAAGNAVEGGDTAGLRMGGTAVTDVDNSAGLAGDQSVAVRRGQSEFLNSGTDPVAQASRVLDTNGRPMYIDRTFSEAAPKVMLMNAWQERLPLHELVLKVGETCKKLKVDLLLIENKASGISVAQEIRRLYGHEEFGVQLKDPKGQDKLARLYSCQHIWAEGMIYAPDRAWADMVGD